MRLRVVAAILLLGVVAVYPLLTPAVAPCRSHLRGGDLFDPVFDIMNQPPKMGGCVGCHIASEPTFGPWFGEDRDTVLQTFETGMTPDGGILYPPPVEGGRSGVLGSWLRDGTMPLGGQRWTDEQLEILDAWLQTYEK